MEKEDKVLQPVTNPPLPPPYPEVERPDKKRIVQRWNDTKKLLEIISDARLTAYQDGKAGIPAFRIGNIDFYNQLTALYPDDKLEEHIKYLEEVISSFERRPNKEDKWERVGEIGVDAGLCWIGDPCYVVTPDSNEHPAETWGEFCSELSKHEKNGIMQWNYKMGHPGLGVSIGQFGGDGDYPVYVKRNKGGMIMEAKVVFNED